jgi:preprotein translocase subunit SecD
MPRILFLVLVVFCMTVAPPRLCGAEAVAREFSADVELRLAQDDPSAGFVESAVGTTNETVYLAPTALVTGRDLVSVGLSKDETRSLSITMTFSEAAGEKLKTASAANLGKRIAILIDGKVVSAPKVMSEVSTAVAISGRFAKAELVDLLAALIAE